MKKLITVIILVLFVVGCGEVGGFSDQAKILKAQSSIVKLRNALEEYRFEKGAYPGNNSDWLKLISPYFTKEVVTETKEITEYKMKLMAADNNISQITGVISEMRRKTLLADSSLAHEIFVLVNEIDSILGIIETEIRRGTKMDFDNPIPKIEKLEAIIVSINVNEKKKDFLEKMKAQKEKIKKDIESMKQNIQNVVLLDDTTNELIDFLKQSIDTIYINTEKKTGGFSEKGLPNTDIVFNKITGLLDPKKNVYEIEIVENLRNEVNLYKNNYWNIEFLDYLNIFKKKLPTTKELLKDFLINKREETYLANTVMNVYNYLDKLRILVSYYKNAFGGLPTGDLSIYFADSIYFKEGLNLISSNPYLEAKEDGYVIRANANNPEKSKVELIVNYINSLNDMLNESFSSTPEYYTPDSTITFFVKAQAKDVLKSIVSTRPEFTFIPEKETTKVEVKKEKTKSRRKK
uniref:Type II secretion system protein GspG C-terminal domain-containing protein n=1 Tax=candidate division WOR-3 bacterium TaxID=2052148 RepID=A0A7C4YFZ4_UNCW3